MTRYATDLATDGLAAWRLTHLVTADVFPPVEHAREQIMGRFGPDSPVSYLVTCPYCVGVWAGLAIAVARKVAPRQWRWLSQALAFATVAALIEEKVLDGG